MSWFSFIACVVYSMWCFFNQSTPPVPKSTLAETESEQAPETKSEQASETKSEQASAATETAREGSASESQADEAAKPAASEKEGEEGKEGGSQGPCPPCKQEAVQPCLALPLFQQFVSTLLKLVRGKVSQVRANSLCHTLESGCPSVRLSVYASVCLPHLNGRYVPNH